ncbi:MAG: FAD-dependent oxidoreductase, partial [Planctomycetota bacterium]
MSPQNQSVTADASARVLIIGGGPAGAACAISLARSGRDVTLAEQRPFPRDKVCGCCLGGTAHALLQSLGQSEWLRETALPLNQWRGHLGGYQVNVPMQTGFAISRRALDSHLLDVARRAGVNVLQPVSARIDLPRSMQRDPTATLREPIPVRFSAIQDCKTDRIITSDFDAVVLAAGLSASDAGWLPWIQRPHGPRGVHFMIADNGQIARAAIHMLCGDHGYVGLVRLEDGRIDVAAALWPHGLATPNPSVDSRDDESDAMFGRSHGEVDRMLRSIGGFTMDTRPLSGVHATGPLRRNRQRGRGRLLAIGDSAGYF